MASDTNDAPRTLGDLALEVRSKNAGPFWMTLEAFMPDEQTYRIADALITTGLISELYHVAPASCQIFRIPDLHVVKVSFPRPVVQGSLVRFCFWMLGGAGLALAEAPEADRPRLREEWRYLIGQTIAGLRAV